MDYEKDIIIDESALDLEWLDQPLLMLKYTKHAAQTTADLEYAKQNLDVVKAELDRAIRERPEKYKLAKVTDTAVLSIILTSEKYQVAYQAFVDSRFENEMAKGAVRAFEQRKESLENLVKLHGQSYFAGPKIPRNLQQEKEIRDRRLNANISAKLNSRRTK